MLPINAKEIPDFPGYYATPEGRIWSSKSRKFRRQHAKPTGHLYMGLWKNNNGYTRYVHRLVLETFVGSCPVGMECRHLDGNSQNNNVTNLCWGTRIENSADKIRHGTTNRGEQHSMAKLNTPQVRIIKRLLAFNTLQQKEIAELFNVHKVTIFDIKHEKTWTHI